MVTQRDLVILSYPFSDLKTTKVRPAIVVSNNSYNSESQDMVVVPLTTNLSLTKHAITLTADMLEKGKLIRESKVKVDRIVSLNQHLVRKVVGKVNEKVLDEIITVLLGIVKSSSAKSYQQAAITHT